LDAAPDGHTAPHARRRTSAAAFYLWPRTPLPDTEFTRRLYETQNVSVLPGSFLARDAHGVNPGASHVRIALVATLAECVEAAQRIRAFVETLEPARMAEMRKP
jgi:N-succinyldiaminopimelate aminotransferase